MPNSLYHRTISQLLGSAILISQFCCQPAMAQQNIGDTQVVVNDVRGIVGTQEPAVLRVGIDVFQNEIIRTGDKSASRVRFQDNTDLSVGPRSEVTLDRFVFDPSPDKSQVALSIAKGVVRFTTGSLPKSAYKITTPTATIGVRGTIFTISVADDGTTSVSVEEGVALVTSAGATVTLNSGMTTQTTSGSPPSPPTPTPPALPPVVEMDGLLNQDDLTPGPPADRRAAYLTKGTVIPLGIAAVILAVIAITTGDGGHGTSSTTSTHF